MGLPKAWLTQQTETHVCVVLLCLEVEAVYCPFECIEHVAEHVGEDVGVLWILRLFNGSVVGPLPSHLCFGSWPPASTM